LTCAFAGEVEAGHLDEATADSYRQMVEGHILPTSLARVKVTALSPDENDQSPEPSFTLVGALSTLRARRDSNSQPSDP